MSDASGHPTELTHGTRQPSRERQAEQRRHDEHGSGEDAAIHPDRREAVLSFVIGLDHANGADDRAAIVAGGKRDGHPVAAERFTLILTAAAAVLVAAVPMASADRDDERPAKDEIRARAEIVDYFENNFLPSKPVGRITESIVKVLDEDSAIDQGTYEFRLTAADGTPSTVKARYTYVYERDARGQWKIVHHHSSKYPNS